jgi:hypothetical protein
MPNIELQKVTNGIGLSNGCNVQHPTVSTRYLSKLVFHPSHGFE